MANLYVIRFADGRESAPVETDEIIRRIRSGELKGDDPLSLYPSQLSLPTRDYPDFEGFFASEGPSDSPGQPTRSIKVPATRSGAGFDEDEKTRLNTRLQILADKEKTRLHGESLEKTGVGTPAVAEPLEMPDAFDSETAGQATRVIARPKELLRNEKLRAKENAESKEKPRFAFIPKKSFLVLAALAVVVFIYIDDQDIEEAAHHLPAVALAPVRPHLPVTGTAKADPKLSEALYTEGLRPYADDDVQGYRQAADDFHKALLADSQNVKAMAMLASTYLNLIESSNKDETTFSVIKKLIDLSSQKKLDLVETLLADVEFLAVQQRFDAAIQRLVEYSKRNEKFDPALFYYLGWVYAEKGDYPSANKYLGMIQANSFRVPKYYYLLGFLHEQNKEYEEGAAEYRRALTLSKYHAKSRLGLVRIAEARGELDRVATDIEFLAATPSRQSPKEFVQSLIYLYRLSLLKKNTPSAVSALEMAIEIEPRNEVLRLEYYSLLAKAGQDPKYQKMAQMYALVLDADRNAKQGKLHEARAILIQAQDAFAKSPLPYEKMADLFYRSGDYLQAKTSYKKALDIDPKAGDVAVKLIDCLIKGREWEEAEKVIGRFKAIPKLRSSIDRLSGDLAYRRGNFLEAAGHYRRAMSRDSIDSEVYAAYAHLMREADECRDAQFFYSLSQRLDPLSLDAILGSAKCLFKTDGLDAAVGRIQDELSRLPKARADLLAGIAELYLIAHEENKSLQFLEQAKAIDPDYAPTYRIEGEVYLQKMVVKKEFKKNALEALKAYSDRKFADPYGYLKRFEIFMADGNFEKADQELKRVFEVSPNFPELHYRRALMYSKMGKTRDALKELEQELKLNPRMDVAWEAQGDIYLLANSLDEAIEGFSKAMELNPKNVKAKVGAGYANFLKRQYGPALALYQAALALDPGNPDIYKKLGMAFRDSGDPTRAKQAFQNYLDLAPDAPDRAEFEAYRNR